MLLEPVTYHRNLNFAIEFSNVAEEAPHYHKETEMVLVLRGNATYRIHHQEFRLKAGDAIVVDTKDLHYITESSEDVIMLTFYINMEAFTHLYPNIDFMIFACEEFRQDASGRHQKMQNKITFLIHHMAQMMFLARNPETEDILMEEKLHEILYLMVNHFQGFFIENREFRLGNNDANPADLDRLYRIITYMYNNYDKKVTLQDVAEMEHLSMYYASHMIKKLSGLSFQNLLNYIRVENSEKLLNDDKYTLTQISDFCGFSSLAYYNKCFRTWHGITPSQYRKKSRPSARIFHRPFDQREAVALLEPYLNVELPEHNPEEEHFSSQHVFLPIRPGYTSAVPVKEMLPLNISMASADQLAAYHDLLLPLNPATVIAGPKAAAASGIKPGSHTASIKNAAEAFDFILNGQSVQVNLKGASPALMNEENYPTPFYSLYKALAPLSGYVCEYQKQYMLIANDTSVSVILFNTDTAQPLNVYLQFNQSNKPDVMIRKSIKASHNISYIKDIADLRNLKSYIYELVNGTVELLSTAGSSSLHIPVTVDPGEFTILTF
ncbi:MAG: AraC family transcriptional regulator [Firmicutes bacterium]|nr:AraC family transcriptional regulator [Bacillota bacterium]